MSSTVTIITLAAAVGSGLNAGIFFSFSNFVMSALKRLPPADGITAMQSINITVLNPGFFAVFFGTAIAGLILAVASVWAEGTPAMPYLIAGGLTYLAGCIAVTMFGNVPLNTALAAVDPHSSEGAALWANYLSTWVLWNHVRTAACSAAMVLFIMAIR